MNDQIVELHVGLAEIAPLAEGAMPRGPVLATVAGRCAPRRRFARVTNTSPTGVGLEGDLADCGRMVAGDVVAMRTGPAGAVEFGKVIRLIAGANETVWIGIRRLSALGRVLPVAGRRGRVEEDPVLIFLPADDEGGQDDTCLVSGRTFVQGAAVDAYVGRDLCTFRFSQLRDAGQGWVLATFEFSSALAETATG